MFDKYLKYEIEDWLSDETFIQYVDKDGAEMAAILEYLSAHPTALNKFQEAKRILTSLQHTRINIEAHKIDHLLARINLTIDKKQEHKPTTKIYQLKFRTIAWVSGVAAAIALLIVFFPFTNSEMPEMAATEIGEQQSIQLPDNSLISLNAVSSVSYDAENWKNERIVKLQGEAFFKVEKGSSFTVESNQGSVTVLGTEFNIFDRDNVYEVECLEGRVQVILKDKSEFILEAGDKVIKKEGEDARVFRAVIEKIDWLNKYVEIKDADLGYVMEEISRYFDLEIENLDKIKSLTYTGFFSTNSLDSAIYQVLWPLDISYELKGNKLIIQ